MVKIGHASIDENGKTKNGQTGDQNGKEVCIQNWYDKGWNILLRPMEQYAASIAHACEIACNNPNIGYNQNKRNSLHTQAKKVGYDLSKVGPCDTDCSAFITVCAIAGGIKELEYIGNAPTTMNMTSIFRATNKFLVSTDKKYLTSDKWLRRGDILVKEGYHTVMVLENGEEVKKLAVSSDLVGKDIRTVSALNLNMRMGPMGSKLCVLNAGELVNVVEEKDGWCRVEGWVSSQYLVK